MADSKKKERKIVLHLNVIFGEILNDSYFICFVYLKLYKVITSIYIQESVMYHIREKIR